MKNTPTPYHRNIKASGKYPVIFAGRNNHVCVVSQQATGEETEANIDFIVRACNSHEELIRRLHGRSVEAHFQFEHGGNFSNCEKYPCRVDKELIAQAEGK